MFKLRYGFSLAFSRPMTNPQFQDNSYFSDDGHDTMIATAWIPLLDTDRRNGGMQAVRDTHSKGKLGGCNDIEDQSLGLFIINAVQTLHIALLHRHNELFRGKASAMLDERNQRWRKHKNVSLRTGQFTRNDVTPLYLFFWIRPIFFLCQTLSSIKLDFLSFTRHIWISIQMNIQRVQWPSPRKAQTCHLQNFITRFGDLLSFQNHWNTFGSFLCTNQVVRYPKNQRESIKSWPT